ncbi:hypothetical protein WOLCODRAFT_129172 [Wolfiporia cocos MD-104 SS10]|uniref:DUF6533 domain-containing protein n=1 Tax=Wolfiporia cocos (strain MD-104) TaxID=742152 RepID=A0A2H3JAX3_WOLCO|nr:hypothetical protein WOLCODRAFT_129172 [Wolfiporia cocos MD-104 SS10]
MSCYDYFLTLDREIKFIWKADLSFATLLFYSCRYPILLNALLEVLGRVTWGWQNVEVRLFASLRVYAMYGRSKWLFAVVLFIGLISPIIWIYVFIRTSPRQNGIDGFWSCTLIILGPYESYEKGVMGARAASLLSDAIVLVLTCIKTARRSTIKAVTLGDRLSTLGDILLKDTAICFSFLCVINIFALATGRIPLLIEICTTWAAVLSSILLSRLALDLHEVHAAENDEETEFLSRTLRFTHEDDPSYMHFASDDDDDGSIIPNQP